MLEDTFKLGHTEIVVKLLCEKGFNLNLGGELKLGV